MSYGKELHQRPSTMDFRMSSLDDDLCCPVCCDTYSDPVVLRCSHSFCRFCLDTFWKTMPTKECPVCRRRSSTDDPPANLALRNIVETFLKERRQNPEEGTSGSETRGQEGSAGSRCSQHGERLLLYCMIDHEAICVVCQTSEKHQSHQLCLMDEAAFDLKEEMQTCLGPMREKLEAFDKAKQECVKTAQHIQRQAHHTERQIKKTFEELHHFLRVEEATRITALVNETKLKSMIMNEKIVHLTMKMTSLSDTIKDIEKNINAENIAFLKAYRDIKGRTSNTLQHPETVSGSLINVAKHLGSLKFRVWEKMLGTVKCTPVTLDPNTAAPWLSVSDDLTAVRFQGLQDHIPDNPERLDLCVCVTALEGFSAGKHSWDVEVGNKTKWDLGVLKASIHRKGVLSVNPSQGFWAISLRDGSKYSACTRPWTHLTLKTKPRRIRVLLDYDNGQVSFYDHANMSIIYTYYEKFTEKVFPFFSPCISEKAQNTEPLRICPIKLSIVKQ
ncbi:hypothetical protein AGOR_G00115860 [Albula goreensis]|uniref:Uncharacterized protein n=1 Tax=Albula goreensis TaxID=1534307 RepID=A0A8T3DE49_9TELE|nr:hypothetical protein AGOR_G00115860 [Albula goreensis]